MFAVPSPLPNLWCLRLLGVCIYSKLRLLHMPPDFEASMYARCLWGCWVCLILSDICMELYVYLLPYFWYQLIAPKANDKGNDIYIEDSKSEKQKAHWTMSNWKVNHAHLSLRHKKDVSACWKLVPLILKRMNPYFCRLKSSLLCCRHFTQSY